MQYGKILISIFQRFSASVGGALGLVGAGRLVMTLWGFEISLIFPNFLRSLYLSRWATREATRIYHVYY